MRLLRKKAKSRLVVLSGLRNAQTSRPRRMERETVVQKTGKLLFFRRADRFTAGGLEPRDRGHLVDSDASTFEINLVI